MLGGFLGFGVGAPGSSPSSCGGGGRVRLARPVPAFLCGGWVRVRARFLLPLFWGGGVRVRVCAWFLLPVGVGVGCAWRVRLLRFCAGVGCVCASGSFLGCGFRGWVGRPGSCVLCGGWVCLVSCSCSRWFSVVFAEGFPGVLFPLGASLLWFGGCRVGLGLLFSPAVLPGPGLFRVRVWFCLESLILAQDERWRRA